MLGRACKEIDFPIQAEFIRTAIAEIVIKGREEKCLEAFELGFDNKEIILE